MSILRLVCPIEEPRKEVNRTLTQQIMTAAPQCVGEPAPLPRDLDGTTGAGPGGLTAR
jgi:hypothetical protein